MMKKIDCTGLRSILRNPEFATDGLDEDVVLDEFRAEVQNFCRNEPDLVERTRTLRFAHSELSTAIGRHTHGAGEKCGCSCCG